MRHDLLHDPLIGTDAGAFSLPDLLAGMASGRVGSFAAMRPHQRPAWHMFLVQLAVLALRGAGRRDIPDDAGTWRQALRGLTCDFADDAPWHLVVDRPDQPGFLQPPDPGGLKWTGVTTPDALDMVITSRNHDLKSNVAADASPQDWIYALVSLQTMEGFGGAGNYGIARMNGGSSSRAMLALAPAGQGGAMVDPSGWWRWDVTRLLSRDVRQTGHALLWCLPWPEDRALTLDQLQPEFIEICRRIRLTDGIAAMRATSKGARIDARESKGNTGDPWAPIHIGENKALTLGERDWTYRLICELIHGDEWRAPDLARPDEGDGVAPMLLIAEAFSRGNSKTDGFRSRVILVPRAVQRTMFSATTVELAQAQIARIADFDRALRNALALLSAEGLPDKVQKANHARTAPARGAFQRHADALFFPALWDKLAAGSEEARVDVQIRLMRALAAAARAEFARAAPAIPCASIMRPRAEARAMARLNRDIAAIFRQTDRQEVEHV